MKIQNDVGAVNQKCLFTLILKKTENKKQNIIYEIKKIKVNKPNFGELFFLNLHIKKCNIKKTIFTKMDNNTNVNVDILHPTFSYFQ